MANSLRHGIRYLVVCKIKTPNTPVANRLITFDLTFIFAIDIKNDIEARSNIGFKLPSVPLLVLS